MPDAAVTAKNGCCDLSQDLVGEGIAHGLIDRGGHIGEHRFVHALTREAVEASLDTGPGLRPTALLELLVLSR